jgi:hypothetical protein
MARNYSRDRLTQALMANMTRSPTDPVPQREMPPPIFDPAPQREVPMINDPAPAPFAEPPAAMPSAGGGGGGRGGGYVNPTSQVGYGYGWNGLPPPVAVNDPAPGFVPGAGNAPGGAPPPDLSALFGGNPYGNAGIEATGGYPSGIGRPIVDPAPGPSRGTGASFGTPPGGTEPLFPPNDVYSAPINPAVFGGQPYGLAAIEASGGYPTGLPGSGRGADPAPSPGPSSFDWSVYGLGPGGAPLPRASAASQFSTGRRPDDDDLGGGPGPGPGPGPDGGPPTGEPGDRGSPPTGDRGDRDRGDRDVPPTTGVPDLPPPIEITDYPVTPGPNDNPIVGLGGPPTEVPPGFGLDSRDFEDRFGFGPPNMDPVAPFDYGVPGFGPGQTPAVGPDNPYQSYGSAEPPGGFDPLDLSGYDLSTEGQGFDPSSFDNSPGWDFDPEFDAYDEEPDEEGDPDGEGDEDDE